MYLHSIFLLRRSDFRCLARGPSVSSTRKSRATARSSESSCNGIFFFNSSIVRQFELSGDGPFRFADVATCDKRRQSDLFHIIDALGLFTHVNEKFISWRGLDMVAETLIRWGIENERDAHNGSITELFRVGSSPSLCVLVRKFLSLYVFLGVKSLNIREVVVVISDDVVSARKILRRLYLVVFVLEQMKIIEHGNLYSTYTIRQPMSMIISTVFQKIPNLNIFPEESVECLLNRLDSVYVRSAHSRRYDCYRLALDRFDASL